MSLGMRAGKHRVGRTVTGWLIAVAVAGIGIALAGDASAVDRFKRPAAGHPAGGAAAAQFHRPAFGVNRPGLGAARGGTAPGGAAAADERRVGPLGGGAAARGQPGLADRGTLQRGAFQRGGFQSGGVQRGAFQNGGLQRGAVQGGGFQRGGTFGNRLGRAGPGGLGRGSFGNRFALAARPVRVSAVPRRPLIGERGFSGVPPAGETRFVPNGVMFHVAGGLSPQAIDAIARRHGLTTLDSVNLSLTGGTLVHFRIDDGRSAADVIRTLEAENIGVAQPNYVFRLQQDTLAAGAGRGDPSQYVVNQLRLIDVHRIAIGANVPVAVIDSEVDGHHPELDGAVSEEFDAVGNHDKPHLHGTGMAGAIAAHRKLTGIAPGAHILAIHAFSSDGTDSAQATSEHILAGIDWAIKHGARVINMSFAGPDDPMMQLELQKAHDQGIVLVAAAGNAGPKSPPLYPAADPNVIAVTAVDANDRLLPQANRGPYIAVAAPGVDILEPAPNGTYQVTTGTSVAAAHVSGIAALLIEHDPNLDDDTIRDILTSSAKNLGPPGRDDQFGYGLVDPYRALIATDLKSEVAQDRGVKIPPAAPKVPAAQPASVGSGPVTPR